MVFDILLGYKLARMLLFADPSIFLLLFDVCIFFRNLVVPLFDLSISLEYPMQQSKKSCL